MSEDEGEGRGGGAPDEVDLGVSDEEGDEGASVGLRRKGRTNSDVSQLDATTLGAAAGAAGGSPSIAPSDTVTGETAPSQPTEAPGSPDLAARRMARLGFGLGAGAHADADPTGAAHTASLPVTSHPSPALSSSFPRRRARERSTAPASGLGGSNERAETSTRRAQPQGRTQDGTTIGRATVDTTLAVIPAEAFKRLTRLFPKASSHIVSGGSGGRTSRPRMYD